MTTRKVVKGDCDSTSSLLLFQAFESLQAFEQRPGLVS